jgi:ribosomal protein S18 acetylase RimI-like enzyme
MHIKNALSTPMTMSAQSRTSTPGGSLPAPREIDEANDHAHMMPFEIRPFQPADIEALYRICLLTGWRGHDATAHYSDPFLLGHFYAAPYVQHDPRLCLVVTLDGEPSGYILGTADSIGFRDWSEAEWFPALRKRYPTPDPADSSAQARLVRQLHAGHQPPHYSQEYPAHLHIDLLPCVQGRGVGAQLMTRFFDLLRERHCPSVHLVVNAANTRAVAFYEKYGFHVIEGSRDHRAFGFRLS